jgi:hypothetical protein
LAHQFRLENHLAAHHNVMMQRPSNEGNQPIAQQIGGRHHAEDPTEAPKWGLPFRLTFRPVPGIKLLEFGTPPRRESTNDWNQA